MYGETCQQREGRALDELVAPAGPLRDLGPRVRRAIEQVKAHRIANGPVVEVTAPEVHLPGRDAGRLVDERRQHAGLVPAGLPKSGGELMIPSEALGVLAQGAHRYAKGLVGRDAVPR